MVVYMLVEEYLDGRPSRALEAYATRDAAERAIAGHEDWKDGTRLVIEVWPLLV